MDFVTFATVPYYISNYIISMVNSMEENENEVCWHIKCSGSTQSQGPFSLLAIIDMYRNQQIDSETLVSSPKYRSWTPICRISEITKEVGFIPPPAPQKYQPKAPAQSEFTSYSQTQSGYPSRIASFQWHWGGFLLPFLWGLSHRQWWVLLMLIPYVGILIELVFCIYFGINGHKIAWDSGRFSSEEECIACQRIWLNWSVALVIISFILSFIIFFIMGVSMLDY